MMNTKQLKHARRAWSILARRAARGLPPLTYKDLSAMLGVHYRNARWFLGIIQDYVVANGLPFLNALAVNGVTGLPGPGTLEPDASRATFATSPWFTERSGP